jgi:hypothetical protein
MKSAKLTLVRFVRIGYIHLRDDEPKTYTFKIVPKVKVVQFITLILVLYNLNQPFPNPSKLTIFIHGCLLRKRIFLGADISWNDS